jgi:pimeloyl-ACP methyl ester carboxylesterase
MTTAVEPREGTVEARGLRFRYVEWGDPAAPTVVLLHGLSAMCRIWDHLARAEGARYHLLAPDQRGHGDTSWPQEPAYTTEDGVGDLEALVEAWALDRFALAGLSMGGMNAIAYAARHPERVSHLVPVDIRPAINREKRPTAALDQHIAEHGHPTFADLEEAFRVRKASHPNTPDASIRHHVQHQLKQLPDGRWTYKQDPRVSFYWTPSNLWAELPKIEAPVLLVRGGRSQVLPDEMAEQMRAAFRHAELVTIEEAGHTVPEDAPEQFNAALADFLARYPF